MAKTSKRLSPDVRKDYERRSGIGRLREFISEKEYTDSLIEYAALKTPELGKEDSRSPDREAMLDRSVAMLRYLRDNGYDYSVQADMKQGQIKAKLTDSNVELRLLDTEENAKFAGNRVYNRGVTLYYTEKKKKYEGQDYSNVNVTPEMAVDLLKYSLGETVQRVDNTRDGRSVRLNDNVGKADSRTNDTPFPDTYFVSGGSMTTLYSKEKPTVGANGKTEFNNIYIYAKPDTRVNAIEKFTDDKPNPDAPETVKTALDKAEDFVKDARTSAIDNFKSALKLDAVDALAQSKARGEFDGLPDFSPDSRFVSDMQRQYYQERVKIYKHVGVEDRQSAMYRQDRDFDERVGELFGKTYEDDNGNLVRGINPVNVATFMSSGNGSLTNETNLLNAMKVIQRQGDAYEIQGDDFAVNGFKNKMIDYNPEPVLDENGKQLYPRNINPESENFGELSEFWQNVGRAVHSGLNETGVSVSSIAVDENGIIHYEGDRRVQQRKNVRADVVGNIGQVFEPEAQATKEDGSPNLKHGLIETKFNSGDNYYIAPGYTAYVVPPEGENAGKNYVERTVCRGYENMMCDALKDATRSAVMSNSNYDNETGVNRVYHRLYGEKMPLDFEEQLSNAGQDVEMTRAIVETQLRRVRYDSRYKDSTSMLAEYNALQRTGSAGRGYNEYLDNVQAVMADMDANMSEGFFDPYATGTGTNQGITRYLVEDAVVNADGTIQKGTERHTPLLNHPDFKYADNNPGDRLVMSFSNALSQTATARDVAIAHMSLGGYVQDDAFVISKEYAERNLIRGEDGEMRHLTVGDKLCDHSGNKGVISFVADRNADPAYFEPTPITDDMSDEKKAQVTKDNADKENWKRLNDFFAENPDLEVVGASYTASSRFNAGTAKELIENQAEAKAAGKETTLYVDGVAHEGAMSRGSLMTTDMAADVKLHLYDEEGGRKTSQQLVGALAENGAYDVINEMYEYNTEPSIKARELLIPLGLDMSQTGRLGVGYTPHIVGKDENGNAIKEERKMFSVEEEVRANITPGTATKKASLHKKGYNESFGKAMNDDGGFMVLPFPLQMASGENTPEVKNEDGTVAGYALPVLAGKYRSSRETVDNRLTVHEYTTNYRNIWIQAGDYAAAQRLGGTTQKSAEDIMTNAQEMAQAEYNKMANSLIDRHFTGKHNVWKDDVMRKSLPGTATGVIIPDPSLDLDEIRMPKFMAESLGIANNDDPSLIAWRDPLLSGGGVRYFDVRIVETRPDHEGYNPNNPYNSLKSVAMNPSSATSFEGDFDGDSMGYYGLQTKEAKANAKETLSMRAQLLNKECKEKGHHDFYFQDGLDVATGVYADKNKGGDIGERIEQARKLANEADDNNDKSIAKGSRNDRAFEMYNQAMHDAHKAAFGCDVISYENLEEHVKSQIPMIQSGAKGSFSKLQDGYCKYLGVDVKINDAGEIEHFKDLGQPDVPYENRQASFKATHAKAYLTGVAGKFLQHGIMAAKNAPEGEAVSYVGAANALTHPVTQSVMQLKHDDAETIMRKIDMITNVSPELWAGHKIERGFDSENGKPTWKTVIGDDKKPVQCTPDEWKQLMMEFYTDKNGLNVPAPNSEHIDTMARMLTVKGPNGKDVIQGFDRKSQVEMKNEKALDSLSFEASFDKAVKYAREGRNLFEGSVNSMVAPKVIRDNIAEEQQAAKDPNYQPDYKPLIAKDTQSKDALSTPSVDAVARELERNPAAEIHITEPVKTEWEREGYQRTLADGTVQNVASTTVHRDYDKMTNAQLEQTAKRIVELERVHGQGFDVYDNHMTTLDREFTNRRNEQRGDFNALSPAERRAYTQDEAKMKADFRELSMYNQAQRDFEASREKVDVNKAMENDYQQRREVREKGYLDLSIDEKNSVAKQTVIKQLNNKGKSDTDKGFMPLSKTEAEYAALVRQQMNYFDMKDPAKKQEFERNPDAHRELDLARKYTDEARGVKSKSAPRDVAAEYRSLSAKDKANIVRTVADKKFAAGDKIPEYTPLEHFAGGLVKQQADMCANREMRSTIAKNKSLIFEYGTYASRMRELREAEKDVSVTSPASPASPAPQSESAPRPKSSVNNSKIQSSVNEAIMSGFAPDDVKKQPDGSHGGLGES